MSLFRRVGGLRALVLCVVAFNLCTGAALPAALAGIGDTPGDCWKPDPTDPTGKKRVLVPLANWPVPIDCALPANTCKPNGNCEVGTLAPWYKWKNAIKIGDCSKPNKTGACMYCPDNLTCSTADTFKNANDCNNNMNSQGVFGFWLSNNLCK